MAESQGNRNLSAHMAMWKATVNLEYFHWILSEQVWSCNSDFSGGDSGLQSSTDISGSLMRLILGKRKKTGNRNQLLLELAAATSCFHEPADNIKFWQTDLLWRRLVAKESGQGQFSDVVSNQIRHAELTLMDSTNTRKLCCSLVKIV